MISKAKLLWLYWLVAGISDATIEINEKLIFPDLFSFETSNEQMNWIEAIQVTIFFLSDVSGYK